MTPLIFAFDTTLPHCAAALFRDGTLAQVTEEMKRGQAERLMPMLEELLASQSVTWSDLDMIAVGVGPGNFTGIRISVAAARGLGLALGKPVVGVSMFEVVRDPDATFAQPSEIVSVQAPRDQVYLQNFRNGEMVDAPFVLDLNDLPANFQLPTDTRVIGYEAEKLCQAGGGSEWQEAVPVDVAARIARHASSRGRNAEQDIQRPVPLYVRPADAAPSKTPAPEIIQ